MKVKKRGKLPLFFCCLSLFIRPFGPANPERFHHSIAATVRSTKIGAHGSKSGPFRMQPFRLKSMADLRRLLINGCTFTETVTARRP